MIKLNRYKIFFTFILCVLFINSFTQNTFSLKKSKELDSLRYELSVAEKDTDKVNILYEIGRRVRSCNYEQGILYAKQSIKLAQEEEYEQGIAWGYYLLGIIYREYDKGYHLMLDSYLKALSAAESMHPNKLVGRLYAKISYIYSDIEEVEKQKEYLLKAVEYSERNNYKRELVVPYTCLANLLYSQKDYSNAIMTYRKNLLLTKELLYDNDYLLTLINMGSCFTEMKLMDSAEVYIAEATTRIQDEDPVWLKAIYTNVMGDYCYGLDNYEKSIEYFNKTIEFTKDKGYTDRLMYATMMLKDIYKELGMYEEAYENYLLYDELKEESLDNIMKRMVNQIEVRYELDKKQKESDLEQKRKEIKYLAIAFCLLVFLSVLGFLYKRQKYKIKIQRTELKNSEFERKRLKDEVQFKNKELMNFALQIVQKNDFIREVKDKLKGLKISFKKDQNQIALKSIELFINQSMDIDKARKEFQMNIELLHQAFFFKLNKQYPNLTDNEKKLALLLRLNYSSKKIAALLNISIHGVDMGRYRLRKKLNINQNTNLSEYLNSI